MLCSLLKHPSKLGCPALSPWSCSLGRSALCRGVLVTGALMCRAVLLTMPLSSDLRSIAILTQFPEVCDNFTDACPDVFPEAGETKCWTTAQQHWASNGLCLGNSTFSENRIRVEWLGLDLNVCVSRSHVPSTHRMCPKNHWHRGGRGNTTVGQTQTGDGRDSVVSRGYPTLKVSFRGPPPANERHGASAFRKQEKPSSNTELTLPVRVPLVLQVRPT